MYCCTAALQSYGASDGACAGLASCFALIFLRQLILSLGGVLSSFRLHACVMYRHLRFFFSFSCVRCRWAHVAGCQATTARRQWDIALCQLVSGAVLCQCEWQALVIVQLVDWDCVTSPPLCMYPFKYLGNVGNSSTSCLSRAFSQIEKRGQEFIICNFKFHAQKRSSATKRYTQNISYNYMQFIRWNPG